MSTPISISTIEIRLRSILDATSEHEFYLLPPALIPFSYINSLDNATKSIAYKFCILAWEVSDHKEIPQSLAGHWLPLVTGALPSKHTM